MTDAQNRVEFVFSDWEQAYPELLPAVSGAVAESLFAQAEIVLDNTGCSEIIDLKQRKILLWLLVAHLAVLKLNAVSAVPGGDGKAATVTPGMVGRIASATEGSVSVSSEGLGATGPSAAWFQQTQYGAIFWQMVQPLFHFEYIPPPSNAFRRLP